MTNLTEAEAIQMAMDALEANEMGYDVSEGFQAKYSAEEVLRDETIDSVWIISYVTPPGFFEQHDHFMYISDSKQQILYVMTQSGYVG